jgi:hypothetical protein
MRDWPVISGYSETGAGTAICLVDGVISRYRKQESLPAAGNRPTVPLARTSTGRVLYLAEYIRCEYPMRRTPLLPRHINDSRASKGEYSEDGACTELYISSGQD